MLTGTELYPASNARIPSDPFAPGATVVLAVVISPSLHSSLA